MPQPSPTGDLGLGEIGRAPSQALELMAKLLTPDQVTASESAPPPTARMRVESIWEGVVTKVGTEFFEAKFVPLERSQTVFSGEFLLSEVSQDDLELVRRNALFYVIAGKIQVSRRRWQSTSTIRFRRIPRVTTGRIEEAIQRAQERLSGNSK